MQGSRPTRGCARNGGERASSQTLIAAQRCIPAPALSAQQHFATRRAGQPFRSDLTPGGEALGWSSTHTPSGAIGFDVGTER